MKKPSFPLLLSPGPVPAPKEVLKALSAPMIHHRSAEFVRIFKETQKLLKKMFQTQQETLILNSSGTGAMTASILNTLSPGDTVLALSAGKFGERWVEIAKTYSLKVLQLKETYGKPVSARKVKQLLSQNPQIKALLAQACESSTAVLHPIKELSLLTKNKPNTIFVLDAISALGAVNIPMDEWGIDVMIGGSQKSFCLPAGLSFIALSRKAWHFNEQAQLPVYYLDLKKEKTAQAQGQTAFSSNVSSIRALHAFLLPLKKNDGLPNLIQHSVQLSQITCRFCTLLNLKIFASSPSLTAILLPAHIDGVKLKAYIEEKHRVTMGGGQGKLKGKILRIGHLGAISPADLKKGLKALALSLHAFDPKLIDKTKIEHALKTR